MHNIYSSQDIMAKAKALFKEERDINKLNGWFLAREVVYKSHERFEHLPIEQRAAEELREILRVLPLDISDNAIFAGTQRDAFARSYALINPAFKIEEFSGYCDPTAVFGDIEPTDDITIDRIKEVCDYTKTTPYVRQLSDVYAKAEPYTKEVAFFVEQVTGHLIPDFRFVLENGVESLLSIINDKIYNEKDSEKLTNFRAMKVALESVLLLSYRYAEIAAQKKQSSTGDKKAQFELMEKTLKKVPAEGADNLYEAIQCFILLWQVMCIEQAPNPFAFSVGNADRIFEPYRAKENLSRQETKALLEHLLVFYNVADRSWAISQNLIVGGRDADGNDLTNETSYALLDAYYEMNLPQPILSVKLHKNTPDRLYEEMGRFFFSPGVLTPSLFNDDAVFEILRASGVDECDLPDYAVAGCQEPLIMGKDNANTTNSWLNLAKILELTLSGGVSGVTGEKLLEWKKVPTGELLKNIRSEFYNNTQAVIEEMASSANGASRALSNLRVPFLSCFMGGVEYGYDTRDDKNQGTKYNGSGCLIHGLSIVADSFMAIDKLLSEQPENAERLITALQNNFEGEEDLRKFLLSAPKFGNGNESVDSEAAQIANKISDMVRKQKNYLGNPFRADWSSPTTHLLYGYWTGATPDGRQSREMLGYGVDPLYGEANQGMGFRMISNMMLPFEKFNGGYASHFGIDPKFFDAKTYENKGLQFHERVISPLFFNEHTRGVSPFYLYVNVTTPDTLRKVLENPKKYAPSGVYIVRIHGTFVNFLDLSPAIQQDIIKRLDLQSTAC